MTLDEIIKKHKGSLKAIIFEFEEELNNKDFKTIYDNINNAYYIVPAFTALLLKNNINPLKYMDEVPACFAYELNIKEFIIPDGIKFIGDNAFAKCDILTSITIPKSIIHIDDAVFWGCYNLKDIYYEGSEEDWSKIKMGWGNTISPATTIHYNS